MKKEELIAMVGKESIGGWWTSSRIMAIIILGLYLALCVAGVRLLAIDLFTLPAFAKGVAVFMTGLFCFIAIILMVSDSRRVRYTELKANEFKTKKTKYGKTYEIEVLGKDGKAHNLYSSRISLDETQKTSFVVVGGSVDGLWIDLVVGADINQVWKK